MGCHTWYYTKAQGDTSKSGDSQMNNLDAYIDVNVLMDEIHLTVKESKLIPILQRLKEYFSQYEIPISLKSGLTIKGRVISIDYGELHNLKEVLIELTQVLEVEGLVHLGMRLIACNSSNSFGIRLHSCHTDVPNSGFFQVSANSLEELEPTFQLFGISAEASNKPHSKGIR